MIDSLRGTLLEKTPEHVVVECAGVGYLAMTCASTTGALPAVGEECRIYTEMRVTENDVSLYGFSSRRQRESFRLLTGVSGVGPKVGLAILGVLTPDRIALAIAGEDHKAFTAAPGVGPKLAQRIVLELKDKMIGVRGARRCACRAGCADRQHGAGNGGADEPWIHRHRGGAGTDRH